MKTPSDTKKAEISEYTVINSWLSLFVESIESYNCDSNIILKEVGISSDFARYSDNRVSAKLMGKLWQLGKSNTQDEAFGLHTGAKAHPSSFNTLGLLLCCCDSLKDQFESWVKYGAMFSTAGYNRLQEHEQYYSYQSRLHRDKLGQASSNPIALDATVAAIIKVCRIHAGDNFKPLKVLLPIRKPKRQDAYLDYYRCPIEYGHEGIEIQISHQDMEKAIRHGNAGLKQKLEILVESYISQQDQKDLIHSLRQLIEEDLPEGKIQQERLAKKLHLSTRSMQRQLQQRGTCFNELLDDVRREHAMVLIRQKQHSIVAIGEQLGFSSASNFARSFRRWTNRSPLQFRKLIDKPKRQ
ncbi:MAG: AraC family transcriptional regulator [Cellvibrionaceae bacterium]|nr:AraC family transcriptional regulator [Cellvibrionaceae bacterium]